ncbi:uncharacterized protein [Elaeis guineensis]|uniref:Uncharacterized protein LOC105048985 n=1 Tax=Elaeis guineensis var. tenera TaxID=51953 RepID=A0A6I9RI00_ELAGV|nr:uncharacterized protein LOC105048985 [Elaeis guineensis]
MDTTKIEKLQAMKRYRSRRQFLPSLIQYLVAIMLLGLFLSSPLWLPTIFSSLKLFFFVFLPNLHAVVFGPKCLFIVCNLIVIFLISESKFSKSSLTPPDIYEEYMNRNTNVRRLSTGKSKKGSACKKAFIEEGEEGEEEKGGGGWEEVEGGYEELDGEGEKGLDELNRRVEDFIAKVNKQRRLEARMLLCYE